MSAISLEPHTGVEVKLPNVRKLLRSDHGHVLLETDLSGADAQVVAWEAEDDDLKKAFRAGLKVHAKNAIDLFGKEVAGDDGRKEPAYGDCKRAVHGTNYGASARTIAITLNWKIHQAEAFQRKWFSLHPGIRAWHERTEHLLFRGATIRNRFGFRVVYFDRPAALLPEALAWVPQSTVAIIASKGATRIRRNLPWVSVLLQVHDSVVFQIPTHRYTQANMAVIKQLLEIPVPYPDPLIIPWELSVSTTTWGETKKVKWNEAGL